MNVAYEAITNAYAATKNPNDICNSTKSDAGTQLAKLGAGCQGGVNDFFNGIVGNAGKSVDSAGLGAGKVSQRLIGNPGAPTSGPDAGTVTNIFGGIGGSLGGHCIPFIPLPCWAIMGLAAVAVVTIILVIKH